MHATIADPLSRFLAFGSALLPALPIAFGLIGFGRWRGDLVGSAFAVGIVIALVGVATYFVNQGLTAIEPIWLKAILVALVAAAIPEELVRYFAITTVVAEHEDCEVGLDLILGSAWLSLGLALFENVGYVLISKQWASVALVRATTAVPFHVAMGVIMGACLAMASAKPRSRALWKTVAYLLPVGLHTSYDFAVLLQAAEAAPALLPETGLAAVAVLTAGLLAGPTVKLVSEVGSVNFSDREAIAKIVSNTPWERRLRRIAVLIFVIVAILAFSTAAMMLLRSAAIAMFCLALSALSTGFALFMFRAPRLLRTMSFTTR